MCADLAVDSVSRSRLLACRISTLHIFSPIYKVLLKHFVHTMNLIQLVQSQINLLESSPLDIADARIVIEMLE